MIVSCSRWPPWRLAWRRGPGGGRRWSSRSSPPGSRRNAAASRAACLALRLCRSPRARRQGRGNRPEVARRADVRQPRRWPPPMVVCALAFEATMDRLAADPAVLARPGEVAPSATRCRAGGRPAAASLPGVEAVGRRYGVLGWRRGLSSSTRDRRLADRVRVRGAGRRRGCRAAGEVTLGRGRWRTLRGDRRRVTPDRGQRPFSATSSAATSSPTRAAARGRAARRCSAASLAAPDWVSVADGAVPRDRARRIEARGRTADRRPPGESLEREVGQTCADRLRRDALLLAIAAVDLLTMLLLSVSGSDATSRSPRRGRLRAAEVTAHRWRRFSSHVPSVPSASARALAVRDDRRHQRTCRDGPDVATLPPWLERRPGAAPWTLAAVQLLALAAARRPAWRSPRRAHRVTRWLVVLDEAIIFTS